jgi:mono/diheme cytochrome c family protein
VRVALLALALSGCALCHAPNATPVPPGIDAAAFIDQATECWTIELRPGAELMAKLFVNVLSMTLGNDGGG